MSQGYVAATRPIVCADIQYYHGATTIVCKFRTRDMLEVVKLVDLHDTCCGNKTLKGFCDFCVYGCATCPYSGCNSGANKRHLQ